MASESELRSALRGGATDAQSGIDAESVIRRAKRRRAPRQVAIGSVSVLAVAGFAVLGVSVTPSLFPSTSSADHSAISDAESQLNSPESSVSGDPSSPEVNSGSKRSLTGQCGGAPVEYSPNPWGLELTTSFPDVEANGQSVTGTVTLTNTGDSRAQGSTSARPAITLVRDNITLWHSNGPTSSEARLVNLAPGETLSYSAFFTPVRCSPEDDAGLEFRHDLPALPPGGLEVIPTIVFLPDGADPGSEQVISGPSEIIDLR